MGLPPPTRAPAPATCPAQAQAQHATSRHASNTGMKAVRAISSSDEDFLSPALRFRALSFLSRSRDRVSYSIRFFHLPLLPFSSVTTCLTYRVIPIHVKTSGSKRNVIIRPVHHGCWPVSATAIVALMSVLLLNLVFLLLNLVMSVCRCRDS